MIARVGVAAAVWWVCAATALASPEQDARVHFNQAQKLFDQSRYDAALAEYQRAYELSRYPAILYRMGLCHDLLGHREEALSTYKAFLIIDPRSDRREAVQTRIRALAEPAPVAPPPPETAAPPTPIPSPAAEPAPAPAPAPAIVAPAPPPVQRPRTLRRAAWAMTGVTGALALAAIGTGAYTAAHNGELESGCGARDTGCTDAQIAGLTNAAHATDGLIAISAAAAVTTVVLFVIDWKRRR